MVALVIGVILLGLKLAGVSWVAGLGWHWVLAPFGLAALWWWWADWSGYTRRKAMEKEEARKAARLARARANLRPGERP
ncbi:small Trp-rich protein [Tepidimonas sediminis]|uniref:Small Trp-rich protein n=1 Tax=Tepidimonas sediminis TaxID=2588941 RepID=A0A554WNA3_9BURK|nr:TIGR04438 family Trp-rich protein [Tepidimonas sediminis]TSE25049.1 small Trp-rich protein [Tepidimonas sediminis]